MSNSKPRVLLGMSGGVDSSVSAILLLEQGFEVIGAFMKNWSDGEPGSPCTWREDRRDAMRVAAQLQIPFYTFDFEDLYRQDVYEYMIAEYKNGRTPNPDVMCNKFMKFGYLLEKSRDLKCDFIATGHYAWQEVDAEGQAHLFAGLDENKDQSYFLCQLNQSQLQKAIFPLGKIKKTEVREMAQKYNLPVVDKKDSQGICFIGKVDMKTFLSDRIKRHEGNIVTTAGAIIGKHDGHEFYTIGQRTGLGIGGGTPYFVVEKRPDSNEIIVAVGESDPALFSQGVEVTELNELQSLEKYSADQLSARIRYRQPLQNIKSIIRTNSGLQIEFMQKQKAVAPGQFLAIYSKNELIASGVIENALPNSTKC
jgi:tRNA-specific 2-thiouridylase